MLLDHEINHCSRVCAVSGRPLMRGDSYFSELLLENGAPVRRDVSASEWRGPAASAIAWWRARLPEGEAGKPKLAPSDALINLFAELAELPHEAEFRYLLGLLLIRRKLARLEETRQDARGEILVLDCPRRNERFELVVAVPSARRTEQLQQRLVELLYGGE